MIEIRMHGRGGQGTVVAAQILAMAAGKDGKMAQSFTSFGAERRGAPVEGFVRLSAKPIYRYSRIYQPDMVVLMDISLLGIVDILEGLKDGGILLVNSPTLPDPLKSVASRVKVALIDADSLARELKLGPAHSPVINTAMLGAMSVVADLATLDAVKAAIREYFPDRWELNVEAADRGTRALTYLDAQATKPLQDEGVSRKGGPSAAEPKKAVPQYQDKSAPCRQACPVGADMEGAMQLLSEGKLDEAWSLILEENPFPAVTGRVCFHPCETACNRGQFDEATSLNSLERFLGDWGLSQSKAIPNPQSKRKEKVAVVGAGPAGLSCAYHLARLGYGVEVYDSAPEAGGVLRYGIPSYRLPKDVLAKEVARLDGLGVQWRLGTAAGKDVAWQDLLKYDALFVGTGAHVNGKLGVPGEDLEGVVSGLSFLETANSGQMEQARKLVDGKKVVVVGGGNVAIDVARTALRLGGKVSLACIERLHEMPAYPAEIAEAEREGIHLNPGWGPKAVLGRDGQVTGIELAKTRAVFDKAGRFSPTYEDEARTIDGEVIICAIGQRPDLSAIEGALEIKDGLVVASYAGVTSQPKVFAGGDVVAEPRTVTWALGSGKKAALAIDLAFRGEEEGSLERLRIGDGNVSSQDYRGSGSSKALGKVVSYGDLNVAYFTREKRQQVTQAAVSERAKDFREIDGALSLKAALAEAERCFHCGSCTRCDNCYIFCPDVAVKEAEGTARLMVQGNYCKSCGICARECPRGVLTLERGD